MGRLLQWMGVFLSVFTGLSCGLTVCPVNKLQFLSYNTTLLPRQNVQASSENAEMNTIDHFIKKSTEPWCSEFGDVFSPNLHINLTFTEPVVITFLESDGFYNNFVDRFSIQYALGSEAGVFMPYGFLQTPQVFTVRHNGNLLDGAYFSLEKQLVAERLRLDIKHSIFDSSNRSCWILRILGCTFREAMVIPDGGEPGDGVGIQPCLISSNGGMMIMNTAYPEPTGLPREPCSEPAIPDTEASISTEKIMTVVVPVAVAATVLCAVIAGIGILCCYIIVARKTQQIGKSYQEGVTVKVLGRRNVPVPIEPGNEQKAFVANGTVSSRGKDSIGSDSDSFHYDMPRPTMYDVPRTPPQRQRAGTVSSSNEYRNPIYDGASSKESNTYESIPYDLERTGQRTRAASENLTKAETRARRASDMLPHLQARVGEREGSSPAMHNSDPQIVQYSTVDKSKKSKEPVPVFEALYDQSSKDDIDTPITS